MPRWSNLAPAEEIQGSLGQGPQEGIQPQCEPDVRQEVRECTYEVKVKRAAVLVQPSTDCSAILILHEGERITGTPHQIGTMTWLCLSRETLVSHPMGRYRPKGQESGWVFIEETGTGARPRLERAPAELGFCHARSEAMKRSDVYEVKCDLPVKAAESQDKVRKCHEPLQIGALVKAVEIDTEGDRFHYKIVAGMGPPEGWVSMTKGGCPSLVKVSTRHKEPVAAAAACAQKPAPVQDATKVADAMKCYGQRFMHQPVDAQAFGFSRQEFCWNRKAEEKVPVAPEHDVCKELEQALAASETTTAPSDSADSSDESDKEQILCAKCRLPVGDFTNVVEHKVLHAECMAQFLLQELHREEEEKQQKHLQIKRLRREEYAIGWKADYIPANSGPAKSLTGKCVPHGMCAIALAKDNRLTLVPTVSPAAAVNLEYLSIALQVRREEGREPLFSLDPVDPELQETMQVKRFEPFWLKNTSAGHVLFESDYHLKELSMGEHTQPVVGMKSCAEIDEGDEGRDWQAREWFVVRKAEVLMSEDGVLIPEFRMGVEAREQALMDGQFKDVRVTDPNHALVKYAEKFTQFFDLIAERKSVIYHLRELAKASILAKYLMMSSVNMESSWFSLYDKTDDHCILEIPQLWNERTSGKVRLENGSLNLKEGEQPLYCHALYGGVQFGLSRFRMMPSGAVSARRGIMMPSGALSARRGFIAPSGAISARQSQILPGRFAVSRPYAAGAQAAPGAALPGLRFGAARGVDLELSKFPLDQTRLAPQQGSVAWGEDLDSCVSIASDFWQHFDGGEKSLFSDEQRDLLKNVFNPLLSDRRMEGGLFVPPAGEINYCNRLKSLLDEETKVRNNRKAYFFSSKFDMNDPGPQFPESWRRTFEVVDDGKSQMMPAPVACHLQASPDFKTQAAPLMEALEGVTPIFDRSSEEGLAFRIYRLGRLEVRTTKQCGGQEEIGAVYSLMPAEGPLAAGEGALHTAESEKIVKVTEYVEKASKGDGPLAYHYYVVMETEKGNMISSEMLGTGEATWNENPKHLEYRNSLAKVFRCADDLRCMRTVHDMKEYLSVFTGSGSALRACPRYSEHLFNRAAGRISKSSMSNHLSPDVLRCFIDNYSGRDLKLAASLKSMIRS